MNSVPQTSSVRPQRLRLTRIWPVDLEVGGERVIVGRPVAKRADVLHELASGRNVVHAETLSYGRRTLMPLRHALRSNDVPPSLPEQGPESDLPHDQQQHPRDA